MKTVVALILIGACSLIAFAQTDSRSELLKSCRSQTGGTRGSREQLLAPSAEHQTACGEFIAHETGLIWILPREKFEPSSSNKLARAEPRASFSVSLAHAALHSRPANAVEQRRSHACVGGRAVRQANV